MTSTSTATTVSTTAITTAISKQGISTGGTSIAERSRFDSDQFNKLDRDNMKNRIEKNGDNAIRDRARDVKKRDQVANGRPGQGWRWNERRPQEHARRAERPGRSGCKQAGHATRRRKPPRRQPWRRQPSCGQARQCQPQGRQAEACGQGRQPAEALGAWQCRPRQGDQGEFEPRPQFDGRRPPRR